MSEVVLDVKNVSKCFQINESMADSLKETVVGLFSPKTTSNFYALKNISFKLHEGETLGIIGKNGAGKSTLLRILSGITRPDEGEIDFYGKAASVLDVGAGFHPELTGRENIFLASQLYSLSKKQIAERVQQIIDFSGIGNFIDEPVKNYSAGMYLRLAFAVITQIDADILIFDEVLGVGDAEFQNKVNEYLKEQEGKKSFIIVSHNLLGVSKLCNRVLQLEHGEWIAEGAQEVVAKYAESSFAATANNGNDVNHVLLNEKIEGTEVLLRSVSVQAANTTTNKILNSDAIEISAVLVNADGNEDVVFQIHDRFGTPLFATSTLEAKKIETQHTESGETKITCHIPPWFFNRGVFTLNVFVVTEKQNIQLKKNDVLRFEVYLAKTEITSAFTHRYPGALKPLHRWTIKN